MNIEKLKELAVPVSERLPEKDGLYLWIIEYQNRSTSIIYASKNDSIPNSSHSPYNPFYKRTHWIDFDLLTTKKRAEDLAEDAYAEGMDRALALSKVIGVRKNTVNFETFISKNKVRL